MPDETRMERAIRVLTPLYQQINSYAFFKEKPLNINILNEFHLFDENSTEYPGIKEKNFLLVHKEASIPQDCLSLDGSGNVVVVYPRASLNKSKLHLVGKNCLAILGEGARLTKCSIRLGSRGNCFSVGENTTWESGTASIMEDNIYLAIGRDCMFSTNIEMMTSDKHPIFDRSTGERLNKPGSIIIEDNVWLGRSVKIGKGVHLKHDCIIGQGSLVTKSTNPYCAYAGTPARLIRENVEWRRSLKVKNIDPA